MAFKNLKQMLANTKYLGVGEDRIVERTQGCWNCVNADVEKAKTTWWSAARASWLQTALNLSLKAPNGENDRQVKMLRRKVPAMDVAMEKGEWCACSVGLRPVVENGVQKELPVADFVPMTYLCRKWTGKQGASVAREGKKADPLPEELMEKLMDPNGSKLEP